MDVTGLVRNCSRALLCEAEAVIRGTSVRCGTWVVDKLLCLDFVIGFMFH